MLLTKIIGTQNLLFICILCHSMIYLNTSFSQQQKIIFLKVFFFLTQNNHNTFNIRFFFSLNTKLMSANSIISSLILNDVDHKECFLFLKVFYSICIIYLFYIYLYISIYSKVKHVKKESGRQSVDKILLIVSVYFTLHPLLFSSRGVGDWFLFEEKIIFCFWVI